MLNSKIIKCIKDAHYKKREEIESIESIFSVCKIKEYSSKLMWKRKFGPKLVWLLIEHIRVGTGKLYMT